MYNLKLSCFLLLLFLLVFAVQMPVKSQNLNTYQILESNGKIPEKFLSPASEKYEKELEGGLNDEGKKKRKLKNGFFLKSNFSIDKFLLSGRVLFNDELTEYVQKIADFILQDFPEIKEKISFYVVRSPDVNAFAAGTGDVFVNMGLIAHLNNEAELALVLCHELQHYLKEHSLKEVIRFDELNKKNKNNFRLFDIVFQKTQYSRSQESEADQFGYELYQNTEYNPLAFNGLFDQFGLANYAYDTATLSKRIFSQANIVFPTGFFEEINDAANLKEDYNDSLSTHPNLRKRREALQAMASQKEGVNSVFGEEEFLRLRTLARFELSQLFWENGRYESALANSLLLLRDYPQSEYLHKQVGKSLYELSRYKNKGQFSEVHLKLSNTSGYLPGIYQCFDTLNSQSIALTALLVNWQIFGAYPDDEELKDRCDSLALSFQYEYADYAAELAEICQGNGAVIIDSVKVNRIDKKPDWASKYGTDLKVEDYETESFKVQRFAFLEDAWCKSQEDKEFTLLLTKYKKIAKDRIARDNIKREDSNRRDNGQFLGLDKVVFVSPFHITRDSRKKEPNRPLEAEESQFENLKIIRECAEMVGLEYEILDKTTLKPDEVDRYNDLAYLRSWVFRALRSQNVGFHVGTEREKRQKIIQKYGTKYFVWQGIVEQSYKSPNDLLIGVVYLSSMIMAPLGIYQFLRHDHNAIFFTVVMDLEKEEVVSFDPRYLHRAPRKDFKRSLLYYSLLQIKEN